MSRTVVVSRSDGSFGDMVSGDLRPRIDGCVGRAAWVGAGVWGNGRTRRNSSGRKEVRLAPGRFRGCRTARRIVRTPRASRRPALRAAGGSSVRAGPPAHARMREHRLHEPGAMPCTRVVHSDTGSRRGRHSTCIARSRSSRSPPHDGVAVSGVDLDAARRQRVVRGLQRRTRPRRCRRRLRQRVAVRSQELHVTAGVDRDPVPFFVHRPMMPATQQHEVVERGPVAVGPVLHVVRIDAAVAATRKTALPVAGRERPAAGPARWCGCGGRRPGSRFVAPRGENVRPGGRSDAREDDSGDLPELRDLMPGLSRADSLTLDPHKGLFLPYGIGALLVRDGAALRRAHEATASYLPGRTDDDEYDPHVHGPELSPGSRPPRLALHEAVRRRAAPRRPGREADPRPRGGGASPRSRGS